ncbi:MAG: hypothetical protein DRH08_00885 [Deltaproteobacteria bacterium]|nr:MAG: hypothetical protein DRH08_00885 [Deltaproteobacteria bacterium]
MPAWPRRRRGWPRARWLGRAPRPAGPRPGARPPGPRRRRPEPRRRRPGPRHGQLAARGTWAASRTRQAAAAGRRGRWCSVAWRLASGRLGPRASPGAPRECQTQGLSCSWPRSRRTPAGAASRDSSPFRR